MLVDASHGPPAGTISVERLGPRGDTATSGTTWSHHLTPTTLVALARELYGRAPDVYLVGCGGDSFEMGDELSPIVLAALPRVVDAAAALVVPVTQDA